MRQPRETRILRMKVTSRYEKYCPAFLVGLRGIGDGLVRGIGLDKMKNRLISLQKLYSL
jgi:hypothetical protein